MRSFSKYASRTKDIVLLNCDDDNAAKINVPSDKRVVTFGAQESSDYRYVLVSVGGERSIFSVASSAHGDLGEFRINVPGIFNISNATAVIATAMEYGLDPEKIREGIASFRGIARRLEYIGEYRSRAVFYDYAHHPTEILQGIAALRSMGHDPITVVFGPHTYSRTADLFSDFARALSFADYSLICDIYAAREENIYGVSSVALAEKTGENSYYASVENIKEHLDNLTRGTVIIMGAADMSMVLTAMNLKK
jgi:UDP-N-acetylmuramate--alanine ligase